MFKIKSVKYLVENDLDIIDNKVLINAKSVEEIDLSKIKSIHLYLVYDFAEVEVKIFLGWIEPKELERLHINKVRHIEISSDDTLTIYIDFEDLFKELGGDNEC